MQIRKIFFLVITHFIAIGYFSQSLAYDVKQEIILQTEMGQEIGWWTPPSVRSMDPNYGYLFFYRDLAIPHKQTKKSYEKYFKKINGGMKTNERKFKKQNITVKSYVIKGKKDQEKAKAFYFVKNKSNVGYLILQRQFIVQDLSYFSVASPDELTAKNILNTVKNDLSQIKSLSKTQVLLPISGENIQVYSKKHNGYIERYAFLQKDNQYYLILDAFYPEIMDDKYYEKSLNKLDSYISTWSFETHSHYLVTQ